MNEGNLDALFKLQAARTSEIREKGITFNYENSAKSFKALFNTDGSMFAEPLATLGKHQIINSDQGSFLVLQAEKQAGRTAAKVAAIHGRLSVFNVKVTGTDGYTGKAYATLIQKYSALPYHTKSGAHYVQPGCVFVGDLVDIGNYRYEVNDKSAAVDGLERLQLKPYSEPATAPPKTAPVRHLW